MTIDYKASVRLPKTDFPMKAGLAKKEPELLDFWEKIDLFSKLREQSAGREKFVLHDGPPYANGDIHIGHALNKILKDVINRSQQMLGKDAHYVPGWDCHGLPIEWKVEERYRDAGKDKDDVDVVEFRQECREFAQSWIERQIPQFKRLGVIGNWDDPYTTMAFKAEGQIVRELGKFLVNGGLYKGAKPVLWSVVEKTALADAEVEYYDHKSITIWVRFPVEQSNDPALEGTSVLIWTTTPWTMPGNRALAYGEDIDYGVYLVEEVAEGSLGKVGEKLVLADALADEVQKAAKITKWSKVAEVTDLPGTICSHTWRGQGYDFDVPMFMGDYVTTDSGTGFVHIAPGHGAEDFVLAHLENGVEIPQTVDESGLYYDHVPIFAGLSVYDQKGKLGTATGPVLTALIESGGLLAKGSMTHSYPHSWRSKAPLIFRNTSQWFISMETNDLRENALKAIDATEFYPAAGRNRLFSMIESRPDWCVSRQRVWGVPLPIFVSKETGQPLRDQKVLDRIAEAFDEEGGDAWFTSEPNRFLAPEHDIADYEQVKDVVEVWFDSGSTHTFVLEQRPELKWPASLYLEGSDQHRGWFHSSLLESSGTRGRAPYEAVLTHGFVLDEQGRKMSKSVGNVTSPLKVADQQGIDILRLWVVASDYSEDLKIGPEILKYQADAYRRFRNTLRFVLGNLHDFNESKAVAVADMPELERWVLHRLSEMDELVRTATEVYDFHKIYQSLHNFCAIDLSALYFDVRKDGLYCNPQEGLSGRACRTVLAEVLRCLTTWIAPFLSFTAEEVWQVRKADEAARGVTTSLVPEESVHLAMFPELPAEWRDEALGQKWSSLWDVRRVITGAIEPLRAAKEIGSSLQAKPSVYLSGEKAALVEGVDLAELAITSALSVELGEAPSDAFTLDEVEGVAVVVGLASGGKCERCWKILPEVYETQPVCGRCGEATAHLV
jgi:isoleucyl-tRNA synthetase